MMRKQNPFLPVCLLLLLVILGSCEKENRFDCVKRTGQLITETRSLSGFSGIYLKDNVDVFITEDSVFSVRVEAGEHIVPLIVTEVKNNTLYIENNNRCNWARAYNKALNVYITMPKIDRITSNGSGKITGLNTISSEVLTVETQKTGDVELWVSCKTLFSQADAWGDILLHGSVVSFSCDVKSNAFVNAQDMVANYAWIHHYGTGNCSIKMDGTIDCQLDNMGDIYCYGNPIVRDILENGTGKLIIK
jgi:Putative auto-transporter adhesin, head GIN domain